MIQNDQEMEAMYKRIAYSQRLLAQLRVTARPEEFPMVASGYRTEIQRMQKEILDYLTRHENFSYHVQSVPEKDVAQQRSDFANLLNSLGQASFAEIEKIMQEREVVEPELGLTPEVVKRLQERIANQKMQLNRT